MLTQLHWQNTANPNETEFVAQGDFATPEELAEWFHEVVNRRGKECLAGWKPMVCTSESEYFLWAAPEQ